MAYNQLNSIDYLHEKVQRLTLSIPELYRTMDSFRVAPSDWKKINDARNSLRESMLATIDLYESLGLATEAKIGIDIKLPQCSDFSEFRKNIEELEFILYKCPFFKNKDESLKFEALDVGSMWLVFVVVGVGGLVTSVIANNIAAFIDKCMVIRSHKITIDQQIVQLQQIEMDVKMKQITIEGLEQLYRAQVQSVIKDLEEEVGINLADGEERGIAEQALTKATVLLDKGMQLYTSIDSPDEVKALFEPIEMKYLSISENLKMIEEKKDE